ncbi:ribokinase [Mesorhizobium sp. NBSH29]|uniref:ribokinase n=1 Tax=Mesorhizobium sp. NBSH29 TaxID=2654249 RepID=UPI0018969FA0|nr:ribokinase [Mesorhizobium sp. NBSH29]QPC86193.1 ribokinase [Mesorhizobium sp. NBSH29]
MIVVIGSINVDLVAQVKRLPSPGETVPGSSFETTPGGKGANQALSAARAGAATRMIGAVGKDAFAKEATALLVAGGVDLSGVHDSHAATGTALILVATSGENVIAVVPGANGTVLPGDLARIGPEKGDVVVLQLEIPMDTVSAALKAAREAGAISLLNIAPFRIDAASFWEDADYLIANETEFDLLAKAMKLAGRDRAARIKAYVEQTGRSIVVTLGGEGVVAASAEGIIEIPALPVEPVDTVGAGDTFCGYLAAGLSAGLSLEDALKRATAAGSLACLKSGAQCSIPLAAEVDAELAKG